MGSFFNGSTGRLQQSAIHTMEFLECGEFLSFLVNIFPLISEK